MKNEDTEKGEGVDDVEAPDDDGESVSKEMGAEGVSAMLSEFGSMVEGGDVARDATVEDFVKSLIQSGNIEEGQVTGLSVFLGGDGGDAEPEADGMGDDEDDGGDEEDGLSLSADDGAEKADDDGDEDADAEKADDGDDADDDVEKSATVDEAPAWAQTLVDRVEDLEKKVDDVPTAPRMDLDESDRMSAIKSLFGVESDEDAEVIRKGVVEQIEKNDGGFGGVDFSGITEDEGTDATASGNKNGGSSGQAAVQNSRMAVDN